LVSVTVTVTVTVTVCGSLMVNYLTSVDEVSRNPWGVGRILSDIFSIRVTGSVNMCLNGSVSFLKSDNNIHIRKEILEGKYTIKHDTRKMKMKMKMKTGHLEEIGDRR